AEAGTGGREERDGHVGSSTDDRLDQRSGIRGAPAEVSVEEKQVAGRGPEVTLERLDPGKGLSSGLHGSTLAPVAAVAHNVGAGVARKGTGAVGRSVVDDEDQVHA